MTRDGLHHGGTSSVVRRISLAAQSSGIFGTHFVRRFGSDPKRENSKVPLEGSVKSRVIGHCMLCITFVIKREVDPKRHAAFALPEAEFDFVPHCHSEWSGAKSNGIAATSVTKSESMGDSAQDDIANFRHRLWRLTTHPPQAVPLPSQGKA